MEEVVMEEAEDTMEEAGGDMAVVDTEEEVQCDNVGDHEAEVEVIHDQGL